MNIRLLYSIISVFVSQIVLIACAEGEGISILSSGDLRGNLYQCGCPGKPVGGLARRANLIKSHLGKISKEERLLVDAGGFVSLKGENGFRNSQIILKIFKELGYLSVNVAAKDIDLDFKRYEDIVGPYRELMLSTNVVYENNKESVYRAGIYYEQRGKKTYILGITYEVGRTWFLGNEKIIVEDPATAIKRELAKNDVGSNVSVILLAYCPYRKIHELLDKVPEVDLVIAVDGYSIFENKIQYKDTVITYVGDQGKCVIENKISDTFIGMNVEYKYYVLDDKVEDDPEIKNLIEESLNSGGMK